MAGISREERERRRLAAEAQKPIMGHAASVAVPAPERSVMEGNRFDGVMSGKLSVPSASKTEGKSESRHWPGLFYDASDPEPEQNNMLGTKDPVWRSWFERNGGKLK